jgi:signal transduction histidine kinase
MRRLLKKSNNLKVLLEKKDLYHHAMIHELRNPLNSVIGGIDLLG